MERISDHSIQLVLEGENGNDESVEYDDHWVRVAFYDSDKGGTLQLKDSSPYIAKEGTAYDDPGYIVKDDTGTTVIDEGGANDASSGDYSVSVSGAPETVSGSVGSTFEVTYELSIDGNEEATKSRTVVVGNFTGTPQLDLTTASSDQGGEEKLTREQDNLGGIQCTTEAYNKNGEITQTDISGGDPGVTNFKKWLNEEPQERYTLNGDSASKTIDPFFPYDTDYSGGESEAVKPTLLVLSCAGDVIQANECAGASSGVGGCEGFGP
jgi:hypothetical protein